MKQTAVEWLVQVVQSCIAPDYIPKEIIQQAKAMEKEQIKNSFVECWKENVPDGVECKLDAEQYYNKTFNT